jgi:hypothetical protein
LVIKNGSSALGLISRREWAVATIGAPQNGHLLATTLALKLEAAPQEVHLTSMTSMVSAAPASWCRVARKSSSCTLPGGAAGMQFSAPQ